MGTVASQITSLTIVYSTVYSDADQRKHQSSASLAFVRGIHRGRWIPRTNVPVTRKMFPFDDVIMLSIWHDCNFYTVFNVGYHKNVNWIDQMKFMLLLSLFLQVHFPVSLWLMCETLYLQDLQDIIFHTFHGITQYSLSVLELVTGNTCQPIWCNTKIEMSPDILRKIRKIT